MSVMSDRWIITMARERDMIRPFSQDQVSHGISYGVSSYGYDISLADEFRVPDFAKMTQIDPKNSAPQHFREVRAASILIAPNSFVLGRSREYFRIPRDILTVCLGKSTYARCGIVVNVTPFEPEWEGFATISMANTAPVPVRVYANEGIAQVVFLQATEQCLTSYKDKKGKYQAQNGITLSKSE